MTKKQKKKLKDLLEEIANSFMEYQGYSGDEDESFWNPWNEMEIMISEMPTTDKSTTRHLINN